MLEHVARCPQLWQVLEEFAREDAAVTRVATGDAALVALKLGDTLTVLEIREESGTAQLSDHCGRTYEMHTDECHAQAFQQLVDTCRQTLESLEHNLAADFLPETKQALRLVPNQRVSHRLRHGLTPAWSGQHAGVLRSAPIVLFVLCLVAHRHQVEGK